MKFGAPRSDSVETGDRGPDGWTGRRGDTATLVSRDVPAGRSDEWGGAGVSEKPNGVRADRHVRHTSRPNNAAERAQASFCRRSRTTLKRNIRFIRVRPVTTDRAMGKGRVRLAACVAYVTAVTRRMADHVQNIRNEWGNE